MALSKALPARSREENVSNAASQMWVGAGKPKGQRTDARPNEQLASWVYQTTQSRAGLDTGRTSPPRGPGIHSRER